MTLTRPWAIDAAFPNASDQRKQLASIYPREGVFPDPTTVAVAGIAYAGTGWGVGARAFSAAIKRGGAPFSQSYGAALVSNDGTVSDAWTIEAAPVSGSRVDLLCIRARDVTQGDSATGTPDDGPGGVNRSGIPEFVVVAGVAGTPGVRPALSPGYLEIAEITTPAGAASTAGSTIVQTYDFAHVSGSPIYVRSAADVPALSGMVAGDIAIALDTGYEWRYNGSIWGRYGQRIGGTEGNSFESEQSLSPGGQLTVATWPLPLPVLRGGIIRMFLSCTIYAPSSQNYSGYLRFTIGTTVSSRRYHSRGRSGVLMPSMFVERKVTGADIETSTDVIFRVVSDSDSYGSVSVVNAQHSIAYDYLGE